MHPILFETKYFAIHMIWLFISMGIILTTFVTIKLSIKNNLKIQFLSDNSWKIFLWGLIGARTGFVIENYYIYFPNFSIETILRLFKIWDNGLSIWTGLIIATISLYIICKKNTQDFWKWFDIIVPSIILGLALAHVGAFFEGINYGHETNLPWGTNFESPSIKYAVPIHPTQFYAFIYSALIGIGLILLNQTKKLRDINPPGFLGIIGVTSYGFFRFLEEFVRGDDTWMIGPIRLPQLFALLLTISSGIFLYLRYNSRTKKSK